MITKKSCLLKIWVRHRRGVLSAYLLTACKGTKKMIIKQKKSFFFFLLD